MQVADNADVYAEGRIGIFFPGVVPSLDGQCVSLAKWFMQEMSEVPNPQAARGDARYVGKNLVAQGHAVEVPYDQRRRGDIICYEYGTYGHIGVVLSGNRTFEQNVNWSGVASKIVDGARVYASRIGSLSESWRHDQHIYRLNTYKEGKDTTMDYPNEGDAVNFLKSLNLDPNYQPSQGEIADAMKVTFKDWAYRLYNLNEGDAVNMLNAMGQAVTPESKKATQSHSFKYWMYKISGMISGEYEEVPGPLFRKKVK